jgi:hypothetical protein
VLRKDGVATYSPALGRTIIARLTRPIGFSPWCTTADMRYEPGSFAGGSAVRNLPAFEIRLIDHRLSARNDRFLAGTAHLQVHRDTLEQRRIGRIQLDDGPERRTSGYVRPRGERLRGLADNQVAELQRSRRAQADGQRQLDRSGAATVVDSSGPQPVASRRELHTDDAARATRGIGGQLIGGVEDRLIVLGDGKRVAGCWRGVRRDVAKELDQDNDLQRGRFVAAREYAAAVIGVSARSVGAASGP